MVSLLEFFYEEIAILSKKMHAKEAQVNRLCDPGIVKLSERLDEKIKYFQRLSQLSSQEGNEQNLLSHEQLLLEHENKSMSFEYHVFKTIVDFHTNTPDHLVQQKPELSAESINQDVKHFLADINESDERILNNFVLTYEGRILSEEEARKFIEFIRNELGR